MQTTPRITVIGNGGFGTAIAVLLARKNLDVTIWGNNGEYLLECERVRENSRYLKGIALPQNLKFNANLDAAVKDADLIVQAVPTRHLRAVFADLNGVIPVETPVLSLTKGIENETLLFPSEIIAQLTGAQHVAVLSGPSMAEEIAKGQPASVTIAHEKAEIATFAQHLCNTSTFRVYANQDRVGVELGGAVKNVIAIAAGLSDGMGLGDNAKAALLARGMAELMRLGRALGALDETFSGLAGVGDLYTTCASPFGRNRGFGERLGKGMTIEEATEASGGMVVEGVNTAQSIIKLAAKHGVEMPIAESVHAVLYESIAPRDALQALMTRDLRHEA